MLPGSCLTLDRRRPRKGKKAFLLLFFQDLNHRSLWIFLLLILFCLNQIIGDESLLFIHCEWHTDQINAYKLKAPKIITDFSKNISKYLMSTSAKTKTDVFLESRLPRLDTTQNARERPTSGRKDDRKSSSLKDLQKKYSTFDGWYHRVALSLLSKDH